MMMMTTMMMAMMMMTTMMTMMAMTMMMMLMLEREVVRVLQWQLAGCYLTPATNSTTGSENFPHPLLTSSPHNYINHILKKRDQN